LTHQSHNFRLVYFCQQLEDGSQHAEVFYTLDRQAGYAIPWDAVAALLEVPPAQ
jgi:hypothetical protein